jgi:hypothetical protein
LMPDFQPTSEVTSWFFFPDQIFPLLTMILTIPCRTQCLPLEPGQLLQCSISSFCSGI